MGQAWHIRGQDSTFNKASRLNDETVNQIREELPRGFERPFSSDAAVEQMGSVLPTGALTLEGGEQKRAVLSGVELMTSIAASLGMAGVPAGPR